MSLESLWEHCQIAQKRTYRSSLNREKITGKRKRKSQKGVFIEVHNLNLSGLYSPSPSFIMYARKEVVEMWNELDKLGSTQDFERLNVTGPPGTGKSMVVWAWTCYNAFCSEKKEYSMGTSQPR